MKNQDDGNIPVELTVEPAQNQGPIIKDKQKLKFYEILRKRINRFAAEKTGKAGSKFTGYLLALPDFFILLCRLAVDKRIKAAQKMFIGGIITYVILPIDLIPDFIPVIGYIDDLVLIVYGLNSILNEIDKQILLDNWSGEEDVLELLQKISMHSEKFLNKNLLNNIRKWLRNLRK